MNFNESKKIFMQRCIAMNLADTTLKGYGELFLSVEKYLSKRDITDIEDISPSILRDYFVYASHTMKGITLQGYHRRLCTFFNFLAKEEILDNSPMTKVDKPKIAKRIVPSFDSEEVHKMLNAYDTDTFIGRRNYTILCLLLSTGVRRTEYLDLNLTDINLKNGFIRVIGKGDKERLVPIGRALSVILRKYIKTREEHLKGYMSNPALFLTKDRKRMTVSCSNTVFRNLRKDLNLKGKRFSAHIWRHTFAKAFLLNGGDVFTLQEILGHAEVTTTKQYVSLSESDKAIQNRKFNPLDNNRWEYY